MKWGIGSIAPAGHDPARVSSNCGTSEISVSRLTVILPFGLLWGERERVFDVSASPRW
jgi:hypothetical protein